MLFFKAAILLLLFRTACLKQENQVHSGIVFPGLSIAFLYLQFVHAIFWQKEIGEKVLIECW